MKEGGRGVRKVRTRLLFEEVEDGKNLSIVRNQSLANERCATVHFNECLNHFQDTYNHFWVPRIQGILDGDDELRYYRKDLRSTTVVQHVVDPLFRNEPVRFFVLSKPVKENGEVVMEVQLDHLHFPLNTVLDSLKDRDREVATLVEATQFCVGRVGSFREAPR
jgi:hypothetical protein